MNPKIIDYSKLSIISKIVREILKYKKSGSVLDIGAGNGRNSFYLAKHGFIVTALDIDRQDLRSIRKIAKEKGLKIKTKQTNINTLVPKQQYDVVIATMTLHFLKKSQVPSVIHLIQSITKLGGINAISVQTKKNGKDADMYLFGHNELKKYYNSWRILYYKERLGAPFINPSLKKPIRKYRAEIVAQKNSDKTVTKLI